MQNKIIITEETPDFGTHETGMFVPDGFFADFQKKLEQKIDLEEAKKNERRITIRRWSIAASICLLVGLAPLAWSVLTKDQAKQQPETEMYAETEVYDDFNYDDIMVTAISDLDIYEAFYANL